MTIQRPKTITTQVVEIIGQRLRDGVYPAGSRIPSESELAQDLQVSRTTVRNAMAKFAADGLLIRKQGDGTYVSARAQEIDTRYGGQWDFSRVIEGNGFTPSIKMLKCVKQLSSSAEAKILSISTDAPLWLIDRIFYADHHAAIYVTNMIPAALFRDQAVTPDGNMHIHDLLQNYCAQTVAYATTDIEAVAWENLPPLFQDGRAKRPLLRLTETFFNRDNMPLALGISFYDDSLLRLRLIRT